MNPERQKDFEESFDILGKKAANVDKATMGNILRSMGLNPSALRPSERAPGHMSLIAALLADAPLRPAQTSRQPMTR